MPNDLPALSPGGARAMREQAHLPLPAPATRSRAHGTADTFEHMTDMPDLPPGQLEIVPGGYFVKETEDKRIEVHAMITNWRVVVGPKDNFGSGLTHGWCYQGTGPQTLAAAVLAAWAWSGEEGTSPEGYFKQAF